MFGPILFLFSLFVSVKYTDEIGYSFSDGHYGVYKWPPFARKLYKILSIIMRIFVIFVTCWACMPIFISIFHDFKGDDFFWPYFLLVYAFVHCGFYYYCAMGFGKSFYPLSSL